MYMRKIESRIRSSALITVAAMSLLACTPRAPQVGPVTLTQPLSGVSTANKACIIEPDTYATLFNRPNEKLEIQEFITQRQILEEEVIICTVYPLERPLNSDPLKFPRRTFQYVKETPPQAQISSRATYIPTRLSR